MRLRLIANRQAEFVKGQLEQMGNQNNILAQQLAVNSDQLTFLQKEAENTVLAASDEKQTQERLLKEDAEPVYYFRKVSDGGGTIIVSMEEIKKSGVIAEVRSSLKSTMQATSVPPDPFKRVFAIPNNQGTVCYLGIAYKTKRNDLSQKVFALNTQNGTFRGETSLNFNSLAYPVG